MQWTPDNLHTLGGLFLRHILDNMRNIKGSTVRLGLTGEGLMPNYQVVFPNKVTRTFRGNGHGLFGDVDSFDPKRISDTFELQDIQRAYQRARNNRTS